MSIWRLLSSLALTCALLIPTGATAQHPSRLVDDASLFRGVLRPAGNGLLATSTDAEPVRFRVDGARLLLVEGRNESWDPADHSLSFEMRILAALLGSDGVDDAFAALGFRLDESVLGMEIFDSAEGDVIVQRIGGSHAWIRLEPGIARPRSFTVVSADRTFEARATAYGDRGRGWFPTESEVVVDGLVVLALSVTDLAPTTSDLAPLAGEALPTRVRVRLPRLPL